MNREQLEQYCSDHGWQISLISGDLMVKKYHTVFLERFEIGMNLSSLIEKMKKEDYGEVGVQGAFPFTNTDELL